MALACDHAARLYLQYVRKNLCIDNRTNEINFTIAVVLGTPVLIILIAFFRFCDMTCRCSKMVGNMKTGPGYRGKLIRSCNV